jgi:hypothetical protein
MNHYCEIVASETITCSKEDFENLNALIDWDSDPNYEYHGMKVELHGELHMFSEENGILENLPEAALDLIGKIIEKAEKPYWEFGISYTASRKCPGAFGGSYARIYPSGGLVFATATWPDAPQTEEDHKE